MSQPTPRDAPATLAGEYRDLIPLSLDKASDDSRLVYDASADGAWWAYRDSWSGPGPLHLVRNDGTETLLGLGPIDVLAPQVARFSPDSTRLVLADGVGALWNVDLRTGEAYLVAKSGPWELVFGRSIEFGDNDHVYVQFVGSVEIPIPSRIGIVDLRDGTTSVLSDDTWAYGSTPLSDGSVAYVHLKSDGSYEVRRITGQDSVEVAQVGFIHGGLDISPSGAVAFSDGSTTWLAMEGGETAVRVGSGTNPRFAPDGNTLVIYDTNAQQSVLVGLDGTLLSSSDSPFVLMARTAEGS